MWIFDEVGQAIKLLCFNFLLVIFPLVFGESPFPDRNFGN